MKKILLLAVMAISMLSASAQVDNSVRFLNEEGHAFENGAVITSHLGDNSRGYLMIKSGVEVENATDKPVAYRLLLDIKMPNGETQCCVGVCKSYSNGTGVSDTEVLSPGTKKELELEWIPETEDESSYGTATVVTKVEIFEVVENNFGMQGSGKKIADGPTFTFNFVFDKTTGIIDVNGDNVKEVARYSLDGQRLNAPTKGLNIVKLANGKVVKQFVK